MRRGAGSDPPTGPTVNAGAADTYTLSGSDVNVTYVVTMDNPVPGWLQAWYKSNEVFPVCLGTVVLATGLDDTFPTPDGRGAGALAWAVAVDQAGRVLYVGAEVDVAD